MGESAGTQSNDIRRRIAEMFHDRITNMTVDMVTAEMEIMGDPFFLPQETGNYVSQRSSGNPSVTNDGTMAYLDGPVLVDINFKTPFDYQISGATMEFPQIVPGFSGTFQVWAVTNSFASGKFTQTLKMFRHRGQDDPATTGPTNFVQDNSSVATAPTTVQSDGTVGQSGMPSTDCMPVTGSDDVRNLMPAVAADVQAQLTASFAQIEQQLTGAIPNLKALVEGVDFGVANVPDLTKVIPSIASVAAGGIIGNALGGRLGALAGAALGSQLGAPGGLSGLGGSLDSAINSLGDPNAPPYTGDDPIIRARLGLPPVNTTNQDIAAVTGASTARVRNLLG
jgi:hypothetical protein